MNGPGYATLVRANFLTVELAPNEFENMSTADPVTIERFARALSAGICKSPGNEAGNVERGGVIGEIKFYRDNMRPDSLLADFPFVRDEFNVTHYNERVVELVTDLVERGEPEPVVLGRQVGASKESIQIEQDKFDQHKEEFRRTGHVTR